MTMRVLEFMPRCLGLSLLFVLGCGAAEPTVSSPSPTAADPTAAETQPAPLLAPRLVQNTQSACKGQSTWSTGSSNLQTSFQADGSLKITHLDVSANCAAKIVATAKISAGVIQLVESISNPSEASWCSCNFDVSAVVAGLTPGTYQVSAQSPDGTATGPVSVTVPPSDTVPTWQSACKKTDDFGTDGPAGAPSLQATLQGDTLLVTHVDVVANCAAKLAMKVTVTTPSASTPGNIKIVEIVTNPSEQVDCSCYFDLSTSIVDLPSGTYQLTAVGPDGELTGPVTVTIP